MMILKIKDKEYKIRFTYNSFCDTDLMDRTEVMLRLFQGENVKDDKDVSVLGQTKELFVCVRDLLFIGFKKYNPIETVQEVGDLLDDYMDEGTEEDERGILDLFTKIAEDLVGGGFLGGLLTQVIDAMKVVSEKATTKKK